MPNIGPIELILILIVILIAYGIGKLAARKGQSFWGFFILGLLIWPIALLVALLVPDRRSSAAPRSDSRVSREVPDPLDRLQKLTELRDAGALTEEEFRDEKARILGAERGETRR